MDKNDNKKGRLVVIEGIDGSGKTTQYELLKKRLDSEGLPYMGTTFPNYESPSGRLVKSYLDGAFGANPGDINPYAASSFYAVDRFASFKTDPWGKFYRSGGLVVSARYTTSNAIHQAAKLPRDRRESFFKWLSEYEYGLLGLPEPDAVFYLDIPPEAAAERIARREEQGGAHRDIHEKYSDYLSGCVDAGRQAAAYFGWTVVPVTRGDQMVCREEIGEYLYGKIINYIRDGFTS